MNSIILSGRKIGNNCIVGAGSVVTSDIPSNSICAGNPAQVIMDLDKYNDKRKRSYLTDAQRNVQHFYKKNKRKPNVEELFGFGFLFMERTEENWTKYYSRYLSFDNDVMDVKCSFFESEPKFANYDEFIDFCLKQSKQV